MRDTYTGVTGHRDVLIRVNQIVNDPTKVLLRRGYESEKDRFWVEWGDNYELKYQIANIIASKQPSSDGIRAAVDEIFEMMRTC